MGRIYITYKGATSIQPARELRMISVRNAALSVSCMYNNTYVVVSSIYDPCCGTYTYFCEGKPGKWKTCENSRNGKEAKKKKTFGKIVYT